MNSEIQPSLLSLAYAKRSMVEVERRNETVAHLTDLPYFAPPEETRNWSIRLRAQTLDKIIAAGDNHLVKIAISRNYRYLSNENRILNDLPQIVRELPERSGSTDEDLTQVARSLSETGSDSILDESTLEYWYVHALRQVENSRIIAAEQSVAPEQVFEDDGLYEEAIRRSYTPSEYADGQLHILQSCTPEALGKFTLTMWTLLNSDPLIKDTMELFSEDEKEKLLDEVLAGRPDITELNREITLNLRRGIAMALLGEIQRFWGAEAANMLDQKQRLALLFPEDDLK